MTRTSGKLIHRRTENGHDYQIVVNGDMRQYYFDGVEIAGVAFFLALEQDAKGKPLINQWQVPSEVHRQRKTNRAAQHADEMLELLKEFNRYNALRKPAPAEVREQAQQLLRVIEH